MYFNSFYGHDIINFALDKGVKETEFLQERKALKRTAEQGHLSYSFTASLLEKAVSLSQDPHFGLHLGEYFDLKATAAVDDIMDRASTIGEAFSFAAQFSRLISDSMDCWLEEFQDQFMVVFEYKADWALQNGVAVQHNLDTALVCACKSLQRLSLQRHLPVLVQLPYPRPRQINEYYRIFNCRVEYRSKRATITFHRRLLDHPTVKGSPDLLNTLLVNARSSIANLPASPSLTNQVKKLILKQIQEDRFPKIIDLASKLGMGHRSLQRHLKREGTQFGKLVTDIKMELASKHLVENQQSIEEVAYLLGYSEASSFVRAFKQWKGITPGKFLRQSIPSQQFLK
ncbi:MAG: AraC family transcriptional regulator ligand-binding domain-containing protein [Saprospiraceae bacterium]|nr:AraC family transcriptional regulator ligand-binding domain-containing protein [Saprospiraceae bacterium]